MSVWMAMLLGLLQGVTVFLPISNSGHLAVVENLLKLDVPAGGLFGFFMNLSTFVSIFMVFRKDLGRLLQEGAEFLRGQTDEDPMSDGRLTPPIRLLYFIIVGTLPLILSAPIGKRIDVLMGNTLFIGFALIAMGILLFVTDKFLKPGKKSEKTMNVKDAFFIGLGQAFAVIPGLSRTGTTVTVGLVCGLKRDFAVRFSIFLSLPALIVSILSGFFSLFKSGTEWSSFFVYLIAFVVSTLTGYLAIQILRMASRKRKLRNFGYYLWFAGIVTIVLTLIL
ncbi:undecaprenyl-diphosphatase [Sporobacter termitidis DSM 10068]|uniref:Undecaprenyl-diphosphatase n=1 Tax=Sporobacter termitidis DSM 10068 TaxID=1123282 RepID=A0A1M5WUA5_9FIRM|nr:undecaprenyl-diphosphate phosphatase [Sporobacter termitidis]SHH91179.1 undecaprenyl-diphosphatase [Sporobacter termitidis DSM 10068]